MKYEDEIKQINQIINKLDIIQESEWQKQENETEQEYNKRIESIEEELEEELLDYISDNLLDEQDINEEEAIKEAQEKVNSDYELFSDAFIKSENGTVTLRNEEELTSLGYNTPEEIEKLKEIEKNINNPEDYINKIKESIKASKDIDFEINRKMELAKSIINAKKRGETIPSSLNPNLERDKFERANDYIVNTITLKKVPVIQNEYVRNNYIAENRYNYIIRNGYSPSINNSANVVRKNNTQITSSVGNTSKVVTKNIPERKNTIYTDFEKKLDKDNDLTKQKIKVRTELKIIFRELEDKELTKEENEELNIKIDAIKKRYPNVVTEKILNKLYDRYKVRTLVEESEKEKQDEEIQIQDKKQEENIVTPDDIDPLKNNDNKNENTEQKTQTEIVPEKSSKMTKKELMDALNRVDIKCDTDAKKHAHGMDVLVINKLISYLRDNNDPKIQEKLNYEITKLQSNKTINDTLYIYNPKFIGYQTLNYMYEIYKNGVKSDDGKRIIVPVNENASAYYLHLANNAIQRVEKSNKITLNNATATKIKELSKNNTEEICYRFLEYIKEKYNVDKLEGIDRLKVITPYTKELIEAKNIESNTEYVDLLIRKELIDKNLDYSDEAKFKDKINTLYGKIDNGDSVDLEFLKFLGDIYYSGLKNTAGENVILQDKWKAKKIYEQILSKKENDIDVKVCSNLAKLYSDNTTSFYDKTKADKLLTLANKKEINITNESKKLNDKSDYVCSDLHGQYPVYKAIKEQLQEKDKLYILGDVIDRGPDGIKILQDIMERKEKGQVEFLIGNHELMMMKSLFLGNEKEKQENKQIWTSAINGGSVTKADFEKLTSVEQSKIKEFLLDSYVYKNINVDSQNVHLVHARSIQSKDDNTDMTLREILKEGKGKLLENAVWDRDDDGKSPHKESAKKGAFTVIGHSPTDKSRVEYENGYLDIDCGAANYDIPDSKASLVNLTKGIVKYFSISRERKKEKNKEIEK